MFRFIYFNLLFVLLGIVCHSSIVDNNNDGDNSNNDGDNNETVVVFVNGERKTRIPAMLPIGSARKLMLRDYRGVMERCGPDCDPPAATARSPRCWTTRRCWGRRRR